MIHQPEMFGFIGIIPPTVIPVRENSEVVIRDQIYPYIYIYRNIMASNILPWHDIEKKIITQYILYISYNVRPPR